MGDTVSTRPSLLLRIRDPGDDDAWRQFVALYGPLVYEFARQRRLQDADAADLTQTVFQAVADGIHRLDYDPRCGSFRGWLFGVVRNQLGKFHARQRRSPRAAGDQGTHALLERQPARDDEEAALWDREYERRLFLWAAERVRGRFEESSWQAFWQTAVEGKGAGEVARALGMNVGAVYTAKSRVLDRLRREIEEAHGEEGLFRRGRHDGGKNLS
jgi:RNA polymerase sigma-70 factor (ECF subfamily)